MKIKSVSLATSERFPGDPNANSMKRYDTGEKYEVHYEPSLGVVVILRKGMDVALVVPVACTEKLELAAVDAMALLTEPRPPKKAA